MRHILPIVIALAAGPAFCDDAAQPAPALSIELNALAPTESGCRLTLLARNELEQDIDKLVLETVLITKDGAVDRLTLFDLQDLPTGRPRVRQFDLPQLGCDALGQVLINGMKTCTGEGLDEAGCLDALQLNSRVDVEVLG